MDQTINDGHDKPRKLSGLRWRSQIGSVQMDDLPIPDQLKRSEGLVPNKAIAVPFPGEIKLFLKPLYPQSDRPRGFVPGVEGLPPAELRQRIARAPRC